MFIAGVGLVILEAGAFNIPCFICSDNKNKCYSFATKENVELFDNFTINKHSLVTKRKKKEFRLNLYNLDKYEIRNLIAEKRSLNEAFSKYQNILNTYKNNKKAQGKCFLK